MVSKFETRFWEREKGRCRDVLEKETEKERENKGCVRNNIFLGGERKMGWENKISNFLAKVST